MSTIVTCPKCHKAVGVSQAADPASWMRCPLCRGNFQLQLALDFQPPMLEPIQQPDDQSAADAAAKTVGASGVAAPDFPALHPDHVRDPGLASLPQSGAGHPPANPILQPAATTESAHSELDAHFAAIPVSNAVAERVARAQKNPLVEMVKIVLGGLAGLVLGYAVLFWGFKADPFHLGRCLPAAFVPNHLRE